MADKEEEIDKTQNEGNMSKNEKVSFQSQLKYIRNRLKMEI